MTTGLVVTVTGTEPFMAALARVSAPKVDRALSAALTKCALVVQRVAADEKIVHGAAKGQAPLPDKLTARHGGAGLVGSLGIDKRSLPASAHVGSALVYAPVHELGLTTSVPSHTRRRGSTTYRVSAYRARYPKRPYLAPALAAAADRFPAIFIAELKKQAGV